MMGGSATDIRERRWSCCRVLRLQNGACLHFLSMLGGVGVLLTSLARHVAGCHDSFRLHQAHDTALILYEFMVASPC